MRLRQIAKAIDRPAEVLLGRREVGPSQSVGCKDARPRDVNLRVLHERATEGNHGPRSPLDPKPPSQTPFGCVKVYVGEGNRKGTGTGKSAAKKNIALMKAWAKQGKLPTTRHTWRPGDLSPP